MAPSRPNRYQHDSTDGIETGALIESAVSGIGTPDATGGAEHYFHRNNGTASRGEREPLLTPGIAPPKTDEEDQEEFEKDWAHVPSWRRPHVFWLLGPFFIFALAFGG